ncbi:helix-turn-helix domain-containing protein [bacterium]|nr:helix-turn-helix domain-containing protein [bacterium]
MNPVPRHAEDLLRILDLCLQNLNSEWSAADVSKELGLSMSKTSRLLNAIAEHGYLDKSKGNTYHAGRSLLIIARTFQRVSDHQHQSIENESFIRSQGIQS